MGRALLWISLIICSMAMFFSLNSLAPFRSQLAGYLPKSAVSLLSDAEQTLSAFLSSKEHLFTKDQLAKYTGDKGEKVYMAILGLVFDVSKGKKHYGPGGGYHFFSGKDGSRAFVTGDFSEAGLTDDVKEFSNADVLSLSDWKDFYVKDYAYIGKLVGNFYDSEGKSTEALQKFNKQLENALAEKREEADLKQIFPPCNSQWTEGHVTFWCSNLSGGIQREWVGVPRQYFEPGKAQNKPRCACVRTSGPPSGVSNKDHPNRGDLDNPNLKLYDGCDSGADSCSFSRSE